MKCSICDAGLGDPIYCGSSTTSLTSLCELKSGRVTVWSCSVCGHLQSPPFEDAASYYDKDYKILLSDKEEDQIYEIVNGQVIYRCDHQLATLLSSIQIGENSKVLDYGCAKGAMARKIKQCRPDIRIHLYDVSSMYRDYWLSFLEEDGFAIYETPGRWLNKFDLITSFFAFEHIVDPRVAISEIYEMLVGGGTFYGVVPDAFGNVADFVVIDHCHHFTAASLSYLLASCGFSDVKVNSDIHRGALVFSAVKGAGKYVSIVDERLVLETNRKALRLAKYWRDIECKICLRHENLRGKRSVIYGSGFYGVYILTLLGDDDAVRFFLDASSFQQGKKISGRPVLSPVNMPSDTEVIYVGLNPVIAKKVVREMTWLDLDTIDIVYIDGVSL